MIDAPVNASFGDLFFSDMMEVFLARSYRQVVKNKFNLLRDLFFVVLLMARCRDRVRIFWSDLMILLDINGLVVGSLTDLQCRATFVGLGHAAIDFKSQIGLLGSMALKTTCWYRRYSSFVSLS